MSTGPAPRRRQGGLTMIEVIAAMVIFSTGAVVLFGWIGQTADRLGKLGAEQQRLFSELAALEFVRTLNPMQRTTGEAVVGTARIRWQATAVGQEAPSHNPAGGAGIYIVQLYRLNLQVDSDRQERSERTVYLAGWRQTRAARAANPFALDAPTASTPPGPVRPGN
jgi:general secretion pathway protein I